MLFSNVLFFASFALAAPALKSRQQTAFGTITDSIATLQSATQVNIDSINSAIQSARGNIDAGLQAQIIATLEANYAAILDEIQDATKAITGATTKAVGGIGGSLQNLVQQQVTGLAGDLQTLTDVLEQIQASIALSATNLTPAIRSAIKDEINAIKAAITPFVTPLNIFTTAVKAASIAAQLSVRGLSSAQTALYQIVQRIVKSLGIPGF